MISKWKFRIQVYKDWGYTLIKFGLFAYHPNDFEILRLHIFNIVFLVRIFK